MLFDKETHEYSFDGIDYTSVTRYLKELRPPFEKEIIAKMISKKSGRDYDDIIEEWDLKGQVAVNYGNAIHDAIHLWIRYGEMPKAKELIDVVEKFKQLPLNHAGLYSEIIVYCPERKLAGTVDIFEKVGESLNVIDIKTSTDIKKQRGYFKEPISHIPYTKENEYSLQLGLYKQLAEASNKNINECYLLHYDGEFTKQLIDPLYVR